MNKKWVFWLAGISMVIVVLNVLQHTNWTPTPVSVSVSVSASTQYEVLSVYKGAVQVKNMQSGEVKNVYDDNLVRQAISGKIKRGDTLSLK